MRLFQEAGNPVDTRSTREKRFCQRWLPIFGDFVALPPAQPTRRA